MKKVIAGIMTIAAVAVILSAQNSSSRPADQASSKPSTSAPTSATATIDPNAKYKIAMKYQPGLTYEIRLTETTESSLVEEAANKNAVPREFTYYIRGNSIDENGNTNLTVMVARMQAKFPARNGMAEEKIDSDNPDGSKMGEFFKMLTNRNFQITLDKDWKITNVDGAEGNAGNSNTESDKQKRGLGADEIKQIVGPFILFPIDYANNYEIEAAKAREGNDAKLTKFGRARIDGDEKLTYKLDKVSDSPSGKIATLDITGSLSVGGSTLNRTGQVRFNLNKNFVEYVRTEASGIVEDNKINYLNKAELTIKLVDKIPEPKAASRPASQATSQASK